jgi:hypothetical protein
MSVHTHEEGATIFSRKGAGPQQGYSKACPWRVGINGAATSCATPMGRRSRDNPTEALQAKMLTKDEARGIAVNIARLPGLLGKTDRD